MAASAAACGSANNKPHHCKEHARRYRENSRRRQAALLFLSNISLDGRPVQRQTVEGRAASQRDTDFQAAETGQCAAGNGLSAETDATNGGYGTFAASLSASVRCGDANSAHSPRAGLLNVLPILVLPSDAEIDDSEHLLLERQSGSFSSSQGNLLSASPSSCSLMQAPAGPRKSSTLLSVQTCSSVASEPRQRARNLSGSPRPRLAKKVHFVKNMRQYDTRGSSGSMWGFIAPWGADVALLIVLICAKRSMCAAFSVLPYGEGFFISDTMLQPPRRRHSSGNISTTLEVIPGLEDFHLDTYGKSVSYAQFLYPTNALVRQKPSSDLSLHIPACRSAHGTVGLDPGVDDVTDYDPSILSDPQWPCGKHKRVLIFASYMTTVIEYVKPSDLKRDMNETFKEKFPHIKLTLSKIRSLKREMRLVGEDCSLQPVTVAMAFVYFEKLVLQGRLNKHNRKLVSAACILLAAKISSDLKKQEVKHLIDKLEERFRISRRDLIPFEFTILVALEMTLYLPESKVLPHYRRLLQQHHQQL